MSWSAQAVNFETGELPFDEDGTYLIGSVEDGKTLYVDRVIFLFLEAPTGLAKVATINVGTNSPNYNNVVASLSLTGEQANVAKNHDVLAGFGGQVAGIPETTEVKVRVTHVSGAGGVFRVVLFGYYEVPEA